MVNGDPTTFMYNVTLKITRDDGTFFEVYTAIGGSNYSQAAMNAVNCYKRWYPNYKVEAM